MSKLTAAQRMAKTRSTRAKEGLKRLEVWAHPEIHASIKEFTRKAEGNRIISGYFKKERNRA